MRHFIFFNSRKKKQNMDKVSKFERRVITLIANFNQRLQKNPDLNRIWIIDPKPDEKVALLAEAVLKGSHPRIRIGIDAQRVFGTEIWERCVGTHIYSYDFWNFEKINKQSGLIIFILFFP